jgi:hypothetical protein
MQFLRQLHPSASQGRDAAHVDLGAWRAAVLRPREADASIRADEPELAAANLLAQGVVPTALHATAVPDTDARVELAPASARGRSESPAKTGDAPTAPRPSAAAQRPGGDPRPAQADRRPALPSARLGLPSSAATAGPIAADTASAGQTHGGLQPVRLTLPIAPVWAPSQQPGSIQGEAAAQVRGLDAMAREAEPATVLHVTIDRIDVRLPPAAPAAQRHARDPRDSRCARSTPLADYLRGRSPAGGAR